jgi:16S rRNA (guanine527-N7)-methyltransferase
MPSANAAEPSSSLPPALEPDYRRFEREVSPWLGRGGALLDPTSLDLLRLYGTLIYRQAASLALIAKGDRSTLFTRHLLDSLNPLPLFESPPASVLDIGSGAGFPGIPLAIAWREARLTLVESRVKKAGFLERAIRELGLRSVRVVCARLEDLGREWTMEPAAAIFIRAVGSVPELLPRAAGVAAPQARWVYFLGRATDDAALTRELAAKAFTGEVAAGLFGGRLLHGRFPEPP